MTDVEWPKEKNIPTVTGRCPAAISRRVMRSIACHLMNIRDFCQVVRLDFYIPIYGLHLKHVSSLECTPKQPFRLAGFDDPVNSYHIS